MAGRGESEGLEPGPRSSGKGDTQEPLPRWGGQWPLSTHLPTPSRGHGASCKSPPGKSDRKFLPGRSRTVALEVNRLFQPYDPSTGLIELCQGNAQTAKPYLAEVPGSDEGKELPNVGFTLGCSDCMGDGHAA